MSSQSTSAKAIRAEIAQLRAGIDRLEAALDQGQEDAASRPSSERPRPDRYYQVLVEVYERGRHGVDEEGLGAIGASHGYDRRGLNGFFAGARAGLVRAEGRVRLTPEGHRLLDAYLQRTDNR